MTEKEWRRRKMRSGLVLIPLGVFLMGLGAYFATGPGGVTGYLVGSFGILLLVLGALFTKFAAWGPVPDSVRGRTE